MIARGLQRLSLTLCLGALALCMLLPASGASAHSLVLQIEKFSPGGGPVERFEGPCGLAVDTSGNLYVSDYYHDQIVVFNAAGGFKTRILDATSPGNGPCGLGVDGAGALYANAFHGGVSRFVPAAFPLASNTQYGPSTAVDTGPATGVAVDFESGDVFVNRRTYIAQYDSSGAPVLHEGDPVRIGEGTLQDGYGLAVSSHPAADGRLYVADAGDDTLKIYDPALDRIDPVAVIDGRGTPGGEFASLRDSALAVDHADGYVYLVDRIQEGFEQPAIAVREFNAAGEFRGSLPLSPQLLASEPNGIAVDNSSSFSQGRVYVTSGNGEGAVVYGYGPGEPGRRLQVTLAGAGEGTVQSSPAGISCPGACAAEYRMNAIVALTASPAPGSSFAGWSGAKCSGVGTTCEVSVLNDTEVTATFEPEPTTLTVEAAGSADPRQLPASTTPGPGLQSSAPPPVRATEPRHAQRRKIRKRKRSRHRRANIRRNSPGRPAR